MPARLTSALWVEAYLRRCNVEGAFSYLEKRGAEAAGAIFIKIRDRENRLTLYGPAPQLAVSESSMDGTERLFELLLSTQDEAEISTRLEREGRFDPDFWVVEVEDRAGTHRLDLVETP